MKALQIPASRISLRCLARSIGASVSNLRRSLDPKACLTVGVIATAALFFSIGTQCVPAVFASGLTALLACAAAPVSQEGGEL